MDGMWYGDAVIKTAALRGKAVRSLAVTDFTDYRQKAEQQAIAEHRRFINEQMEQARAVSGERSRSLANAIAANGLMLRGMEVGFVTGELNYQAIREISEGIEKTRAFQSLMADGSGERLAQNGSVDALVRDLLARDRELSDAEPPTRPAVDVMRGIEAKVRARTAQPRDFATLAAAHRMTTWRGKGPAPDGKIIDLERHDINKPLDGKMLREETDRVMADPDFQYLIEHEKPESLYINALRFHGMAFEQYPQRAEKLRALETERSKDTEKSAGAAKPKEPAAPQRNEQGPAR